MPSLFYHLISQSNHVKKGTLLKFKPRGKTQNRHNNVITLILFCLQYIFSVREYLTTQCRYGNIALFGFAGKVHRCKKGTLQTLVQTSVFEGIL
jgi:hypothetical protein